VKFRPNQCPKCGNALNYNEGHVTFVCRGREESGLCDVVSKIVVAVRRCSCFRKKEGELK